MLFEPLAAAFAIVFAENALFPGTVVNANYAVVAMVECDDVPAALGNRTNVNAMLTQPFTISFAIIFAAEDVGTCGIIQDDSRILGRASSCAPCGSLFSEFSPPLHERPGIVVELLPRLVLKTRLRETILQLAIHFVELCDCDPTGRPAEVL